MDTNFEKMLFSIKQYVDDKAETRAPLEHDHANYPKRTQLANVAYTGSYFDLLDIPDLKDTVTKEELESILKDYYADDEVVKNLISSELSVDVSPDPDLDGKIDLGHIYAILVAMKQYVYLNGLAAGSPVYVGNEPPDDIHKIWLDSTDDLEFNYGELTMEAMNQTINVFKTELNALKGEVEYLKRHGVSTGGDNEDKFAILLSTGDPLVLMSGDTLDFYDTE